MHHDLKLWPEWFEAKLAGKKPWELRCDRDRHFQPDDTVTFHEWEPLAELFTGRIIGPGTITLVLGRKDSRMIRQGCCIFSHTFVTE